MELVSDYVMKLERNKHNMFPLHADTYVVQCQGVL